MSCVNQEPISAALIPICISTEQDKTTHVSETHIQGRIRRLLNRQTLQKCSIVVYENQKLLFIIKSSNSSLETVAIWGGKFIFCVLIRKIQIPFRQD